MRPGIFILLCSFFLTAGYSQEVKKDSYSLASSTLGVSGSSNTISTKSGKYIISQSVGQASVIGTSYKKGYGLLQGYQQSLISITLMEPPVIHTLKAVIYPNPFHESINISFTDPISEEVIIFLFDTTGRAVYSQKIPAAQRINLPMTYISKGIYILRVTSGKRNFAANLIKN